MQIQIIKSAFYDSLLTFKTSDIKIINLNDCPMRDENELKKFRKKYGTFDVTKMGNVALSCTLNCDWMLYK